MVSLDGLKKSLLQDEFKNIFCSIYGDSEINQKTRYLNAIENFEGVFGQSNDVWLFSAPGRSEISGNHTDHQHGKVLAAAVSLDIIGVVTPTLTNVIRVKSDGYDICTVSLDDLSIIPDEKNTSQALIRGIAAKFQSLELVIGGFDAYLTSLVPKGSGLSSSAAFEVIIGTIFNCVYNNAIVSAVDIAKIGQYAENVYFGKPSGLMDQMASSVGGFVSIDFKNPEKPKVEQIDFNLASSGYSLFIVNAGGNHANLTHEYAAIPAEMKSVANAFDVDFLSQVNEKQFMESIGRLRDTVSDRAILRAIHFFEENHRVEKQTNALKAGDIPEFLKLVCESGDSSFMYLQNIYPSETSERSVALSLALSEKILCGCGAWRVHGGGFAGTMQAFVPHEKADQYTKAMEAVFGKGCCYNLAIRSKGGIQIQTDNV